MAGISGLPNGGCPVQVLETGGLLGAAPAVGLALSMAGGPALGIVAASFFAGPWMAGAYVGAWPLMAGRAKAGLGLPSRKDIADSPTRRGTPKKKEAK